ncbi:unnamed protein product [Protopolystoma xenopodis]|uniref:Uncharacterized protein n=1 Tax=Protopolystoma xenopodis TaxID=117903 RepID=A0A3S5A7E4_9PLAT|nr:unnamed protein product [Protopolystoma xenopodis]
MLALVMSPVAPHLVNARIRIQTRPVQQMHAQVSSAATKEYAWPNRESGSANAHHPTEMLPAQKASPFCQCVTSLQSGTQHPVEYVSTTNLIAQPFALELPYMVFEDTHIREHWRPASGLPSAYIDSDHQGLMTQEKVLTESA